MLMVYSDAGRVLVRNSWEAPSSVHASWTIRGELLEHLLSDLRSLLAGKRTKYIQIELQ